MSDALLLPKTRLDDLIGRLLDEGFRVVGPVVQNGAVVFDEVRSASDLARGLRDRQEAGQYRLEAGGAAEIFGVVNGPGSLKPFFFAPREPLLEMRREKKGFRVREIEPEAPPVAVLGARPCDLAALAIQDRIFLDDRFRDAHYAARREGALLIAVECTRPASTCFCASMGTGPAATPRLRPGPDRARRRLRGSHRLAARRGADRPPAAGRRRRGRRGRSAAAGRRLRRLHVAPARHLGPPAPAVRGGREPALERRGAPLPVVHQLHDGVPDLLLPRGRRRDGDQRRRQPARAASGTPASRASTPTSTARTSGPRFATATGSG